MQIDPKDMIPLKLSEFRPGGYFYLKEREGFMMCKITDGDLDDWKTKGLWRAWLQSNSENLFLNRNSPWSAMNGRQPDWEEILIKK